MAEKNEKIDMFDFAVHDCTQEQNGSPYFSSIVRMQLAASVKKDCWDPEILLPLIVMWRHILLSIDSIWIKWLKGGF